MKSLCLRVVVVMCSVLCVLASLAIHPDKIRIATGQIAGVDKDGKVTQAVLSLTFQCVTIHALFFTGIFVTCEHCRCELR